MCAPIELTTSLTTSAISSSRPSKWYEMSPVLDSPARLAIWANEAFR